MACYIRYHRHPPHLYNSLAPQTNQTLLSVDKQRDCALKRAAISPLFTSIVLHKQHSGSNLWRPWWRTAGTRFSWPAEPWVEQTGWHTSTLSSVCPSRAEPGALWGRRTKKAQVSAFYVEKWFNKINKWNWKKSSRCFWGSIHCVLFIIYCSYLSFHHSSMVQ